ncbi:MAG: HmuY family protein, partial [Treponema sp.]|nr:HmuY family protein [Treponema sp.]
MKQRVVRVYGWLYLMVAVLFFVGCPTDSDDDGDAATPIISDSSQLKDATYEMDAEDVTPLSVVATITDGGVLTYQWYVSTGEEVPGTPLPSQAPHTSYIPSTDTIGIRWYYVEVTNTNTKVTGKQTVTTVGKKVQIEITSKEEAVFGETGASVYDLDGKPFTGNYTVNVRFLNANGKKRDVKVGTIEDGKLTFAIFQSLLPNEDELVPYPAMSGITMTPSDLKVAHWEFCLTGTDAAAATLGLEYRKADQSIMGSYGRSCQYFSSDATITGSVSDGDEGMTFTMSLQIDAKKGWNRTYEVLKMLEKGIESSMTTSSSGIPSDCQWSFRNLSEDFRDTETPSYVKEGEIIFQVDSSNGPRFFSLSTGEWVDASEAASKNWDLAFQRMRKIYTNSGTSA